MITEGTRVGALTDIERYRARRAALAYYNEKVDKPSDAVLGFIERNGIIGKTSREIDALIRQAEKLSDGTILGEGDKFKAWCRRRGRELPSDDLVRRMNADPHGARQEILGKVPDAPHLWRSYCTYLAGAGR